MEGIDVASAIALYQTQYGLVDTIWGYYSVVTLAVVGFVVGSDKAVRSMREPVAIVGAYLVFCVGNHFALREVYSQLKQLSDILLKQVGSPPMDLSAFNPMSKTVICWTHIAFTVAVCAGILYVARSRQKTKTDST